jgi:hypothetical protein
MSIPRTLLSVALAVLFVVSAVAAPFPIAEPRVGGAPGYRRHVSVASSDEQYLLVWQDSRGGHERTWAARMARNGAVVDPVGIPLDEGTPSAFTPVIYSVASDGRDFLVAVQREQSLTFIRVTREGVVEPAPAPGFASRYGRLVWLRDAYAFFIEDVSAWGRMAILDRSGRVLIQPKVVISSNVRVQALATLSPDGAHTLVAWADAADGRVYAARTSAAALRNATFRVSTTPLQERVEPGAYGLVAASSPSRHFLVWYEGRELRGRVLDINGSPVGEKLAIATEAAASASVAWNGSRFVLAYSVFDANGRRLVVSEHDEDGTLVGTPLRQPTWGADARVASSGGDTLVAWRPAQTDGTAGEEIRADVVSGSMFLRPAEGILVSRSMPWSQFPEVVWRGDHYLAVWTEWGKGYQGAIGRFDAQGRLLDGPGRTLGEFGFFPRVATDGRNALVVWRKPGSGLGLMHVAADGAMTERTVTTDSSGAVVDVLWNGEEFAFCAGNLLGTAAADGTIRKTATREHASDNCGLQWTGSQYILFWTVSEICFPVCRVPTYVRAQSYSRNLNPIGAPVTLTGSDVDDHAVQPVRAARAGDRTLLTWHTTQNTLRAIRISDSGLLLDPVNGFEIDSAATLTDVHADGSGWVVGSGPYAWTIARSGHVGARETRYPFVSELAEAITVRDGPAPLVIHQTEPGGAEQVRRLLGQFLIPRKQRAARR